MLVTLKDILEHARTHRYAVPAFDVSEDVIVRTVLETAQANNAPVILMCLQMYMHANALQMHSYIHTQLCSRTDDAHNRNAPESEPVLRYESCLPSERW